MTPRNSKYNSEIFSFLKDEYIPKIIKNTPTTTPKTIKNVPIAAASLKHIKNFEFEVYFINMTMVCSIPKCFPYSL